MPEQGKMSNNVKLEDFLFASQRYPSLSEQDKQGVFQRLTEILRDQERTDIREKVLNSLENLTHIYKPSGNNLEVFKKLCEHDLKKEMLKMIIQQDENWAKLWQFIVKLLGCETHGSKGLLNSLLNVLEKAMKSKDNHTLVLSFKCWYTLIDNFALNLDILAAQRRVDLLIIPLKSKIAKDPDTITVKFYTWWHLIVQLKTGLEKHYNDVLNNFYLFCFGPPGKDSSLNSLKLSNRVPGLAKDILISLAFSLGAGIPDIEEKLGKIQTTLEVPTVPIFPNSRSFALFYVNLITFVADNIMTSPCDEISMIAFEALVHRVGQLQIDNEQFWQNAVTELLKVVKNSTKMKGMNDIQGHCSLVTSLIDILLSSWSAAILDIPLVAISATPRALLLDILLQEECIMLNTKTSLDKNEDRFVKLIRILLERKGSVIAGPEIIADVGKITQAIEKTQTVLVEDESSHLTKLFNLWDQLSRVVVKVLPSETANEECNAICKQNLLGMLLSPLKLRLKHQTAKSTSNMTVHLTTWKQLFTKYAEVSALTLTLNKKDIGDTMCEEFLHLLKADTCTTSVILAFVQLTNQLVSIYPPQVDKEHTELSEDLAILNLLTREAIILESIAIDDPVKSRKAANLLAKTLQSVMIMQNSINTMLKILKIFYHILSTPSMKQNTSDENVSPISELWKMFAHQFNMVASKIDNADARHLKCELRDHLHYITKLKSHYNIKVQQGATDLESTFDVIISRPKGRASLSLIRQEEQKNLQELNVFTPPSQSLIGRKRSRKQSLVQNALPTVGSVPSTASTASSSPARPRPCLEEEDSQDFVKIAPKPPKANKVLTPHQRESKRRRRDDIPALYQGLSQDTFNSQDTQDTQDTCVVMSSGAPVTSIQSICMDEDAIDIDLQQKIMSQKNKDLAKTDAAVEEEEIEEDVIFPDPFTPTKNDTSFSSPKSSPCTSEGRKSKRKQQFPTSNDDVIIIEETLGISKLGEPLHCDKTPVTVDPVSEKISTKNVNAVTEKETTKQNIVEESQDVDIIENSQNIATFPVEETPIINNTAADTEVINKVVTIDQSRKSLRSSYPVQNRQGVSLPKRGTKILTDSSNKEKPLNFQTRAISGRAAQMLEMANANREATTESKSSPITTPISEAKQEVLAFAESRLPSNTFIVPIGKLSDQTKISETQVAAEKSPVKTNTASNSVSTPLSSIGKSFEKRSNLKRGTTDDGTPSPKRSNRRVSFAEPVVTSEQESPKILNEESTYVNLYRNGSPMSVKSRGKSPRVSRKLYDASSKADATGFPRRSRNMMSSLYNLPSQGSQSIEVPATSDAPIFPALINCQESIQVIAANLSSPMLEISTIEHLHANKITTIGELSSLSEISINNLSIKEPKIQTVKDVLLEYATSTDETFKLEAEDDEPVVVEPDDIEDDEPVVVEPGDIEDDEPVVVEPDDIEDDEPVVVEPDGMSDDGPSVVEPDSMADNGPSVVELNNIAGDEPSGVELNKIADDEPVVLKPIPSAEEVEEEVTVNSKSTDPIALIEEPREADDASSSLSADLNKLIQQHSLQSVLQALGRDNEVFEHAMNLKVPANIVKNVVGNENTSGMLKMLGKEQVVLEHALSQANPQEVVSKLAQQITVAGVLNALDQQTEVANYVSTRSMNSAKRQSKAEILKDLGSEKEVINFSVANSNPLALIEKAAHNQNMTDVLKVLGKPQDVLNYALTTTDPLEIIKKLSDKVPVPDILKVVGKKDEVLAYTLAQNKPQEILNKISSDLNVPDVLKLLNSNREIIQYVVSNTDPAILIKSVTEKCTVSNILKAVNCPEEVLSYTVSNSTPDEVLSIITKEHSTSQVLQALGKQDEILELVLSNTKPESILSTLKTMVGVEEILKSLGEKETVLNCAMTSLGPLTTMSRAADMLKGEQIKIVVENLDTNQQQHICGALPVECLHQRLDEILTSNNVEGRDAISQTLVSRTSDSQIISAFTQRCSKLKSKDLNTDQLKTILSLIPLNILLKKLKTVLDSEEESVELKKSVLKVITCTELMNHFIRNIKSQKFSFEQLELNQVTDICNLMPQDCILARIEAILADGQSEGAKVLKHAVLQHISSLQLLEQLTKKENEGSDETIVVRGELLSLLLQTAKTEVVLQAAANNLKPGDMNKTMINYIKSIASHLSKQDLVDLVIKTELEGTEKYILLEHLVNCTPMKDTMSRLPIKDVISYYDNLITMPESRAAMIRSCFNKLSDQDMVRFYGTCKMLPLITKEISCKEGSITSKQVADIIPCETIVTKLCEFLEGSKSSNPTMQLLKLHFPREKLGDLVKQILMDPK